MEDRRAQRNHAATTYALWFRDVPPGKRPSFRRYLSELQLLDEPEEHFLARLSEGPGGEPETSRAQQGADSPRARAERARARQRAREAAEARGKPQTAPLPTGDPAEASNEWGEWTVGDMMEYKARLAEAGALEEG